MDTHIVIGVMGAGDDARDEDVARAERVGELLAREGWVVLTGGRPAGVMAAAVRGAKRVAGSLTVGVLPGEGGAVAPGVDIAIYTGLGNARNAVNVLSSRVVITCGHMGPGTASEAALALKAGRPLVLLAPSAEAAAFLTSLDSRVRLAETVEDAVEVVREIVGRG